MNKRTITPHDEAWKKIYIEFDCTEYCKIEKTSCTEYLVCKNNLWGIVDVIRNYKLVVPTEYCEIKRISSNIYFVCKNNLWGVIDINKKDKLIVPTEYCEIKRISSNEYLLCKNNLWGVYNINRIIIPVIFESVHSFSNSFFIMKKCNKFSIFRHNGDLYADHIDHIEYLDYANLKIQRGKLYGINDIIPIKYNEIQQNGHYFMIKDDNGYGLFNRKYELVIPCQYENIEIMELGYIMVKRNNLYGLFNKEYREVIPCQYENIHIEYYKRTNFKGTAEIKLNYIIVKKNNLYGLLNNEYKEIIPCRYENIHIDKVHIKVKKNGHYGLFDKNVFLFSKKNTLVVPIIYEDIQIIHKNNFFGVEDIYSGYIIVKKNNLYGILDLYGHTLVPTLYEEVKKINSTYGYYLIKKNGKYGIYSSLRIKEELIPCIFDNIREGANGFNCKGGNRTICIPKTGLTKSSYAYLLNKTKDFKGYDLRYKNNTAEYYSSLDKPTIA